jgi:hypothetical protein
MKQKSYFWQTSYIQYIWKSEVVSYFFEIPGGQPAS